MRKRITHNINISKSNGIWNILHITADYSNFHNIFVVNLSKDKPPDLCIAQAITFNTPHLYCYNYGYLARVKTFLCPAIRIRFIIDVIGFNYLIYSYLLLTESSGPGFLKCCMVFTEMHAHDYSCTNRFRTI